MRLPRIILTVLSLAAVILVALLPSHAAGKTAGREWFQTVPTRTPTPAPATATATLPPPTVTPTRPPPTATPTRVAPTATPARPTFTPTPRPGPTDTPEPGITATPTAPLPTPTATPAPPTATPSPVGTAVGTPTATRPAGTAGLSVAITGAVMVMPGQLFTVSVTAVNIGTVTLEQGVVDLVAPPALTLATGQAVTGAFDASQRRWLLTNLAPNRPQTLTLVFRVGSGVPLGSVLDIEARAADRAAVLTVGLPPAFLPAVGGNPGRAAGS